MFKFVLSTAAFGLVAAQGNMNGGGGGNQDMGATGGGDGGGGVDTSAVFKKAEIDSVNVFDLRDEIAELSRTVSGVRAKLEKTEQGMNMANSAMAASVDLLNPSSARADNIAQVVGEVAAKVNTLSGGTRATLAERSAETNARVTRVRNKLSAAIAAVGSRADDVVAVTDAIENAGGSQWLRSTVDTISGLAHTHYVNKKIPVFRWNTFSTYNQNCCWLDRDRTRAFGGVRPQQWGDGNYKANDMTSDITVLKRLFNRQMTGDAGMGANVCIENWMMPHSTDDRRCMALFRIKNTETAEKTWSVNWSFTGWSGWGNQASVAVNKQNVWNGNCHHFCDRDENLKMAANARGDRVNTVIFVAGGTHPYGHYNHYRSLMLTFNSLNLPDGLEFVDDMETATGTWA
jgi:hypothetical protein